MKQKVFLLALFLTSAVLSVASTCEVRVDQHQKATTQQRIDYCLNEPAAPAAQQNGPELIYKSISYQKEPPKAEPSKPLKQQYFDENEVGVERKYIDSARFPAFKNDIMSEQELKALNAQQKLSQTSDDTLRHAVKPGRVLVPAGQKQAVTTPQGDVKQAAQSSKLEKPSRLKTPAAEPAQSPLETVSSGTKQPKEISYTQWMEQQALSGYLPENQPAPAN